MQTEKIEVTIEDGLIVVPPESVPSIFSNEESIQRIVERIKAEVSSHVPDLTTNKGRKAIASTAMKVSKSKIVLDALGKDLVTGMKEQCKVIDSARKIARDSLDEFRDEVRSPLTKWEEDQEAIAAAELAKLKLAQDYDEAVRENETYDLRRKAAEQQAEIDRLQQVENDRIETERVAKETVAREEQIRIEERAAAARESTRLIQEEKDNAEAKIKAERVKAEMAKIEEARQLRIQTEEQERIASNKRRQGQINRAIVIGLVSAMSDAHSGNAEEADVIARAIVTAIAKGLIPNVLIKY